MSFYCYMLHCRGGYFYVGHTEELEARLWQHEHGTVPGFARNHLPVKLVWCENFSTRDERLRPSAVSKVGAERRKWR